MMRQQQSQCSIEISFNCMLTIFRFGLRGASFYHNHTTSIGASTFYHNQKTSIGASTFVGLQLHRQL